MTHLWVHEYRHVPIARTVGEGGFTRTHADALHAAACAHPLAHEDGANILVYGRDRLTARQVVGVLAAPGCSLEILPKVDPDAPNERLSNVRQRLVHMLDVALGLGLSEGGAAPLARQSETLLDILIRSFADKLLAEVRRGLPRRYNPCEEDLSVLRGRLDVVRQFTANAVRPDKLACRFDQLEVDTPLMRIMKAAVVFLGKHARAAETRRRLIELRHLLDDVTDVPPKALPWDRVQLDRSNRRWVSLHALAKLFLKWDWQATHHSSRAGEGITLLFPMNDLFEAYVAALLRRALVGSGVEVVAQGGLVRCLGDWSEGETCQGHTFQTKPDIILRRGGNPVAIIDTKWKMLGAPEDRKHGVSQSDVYQLMAYSRLYHCRELMLLYPSSPKAEEGVIKDYGIHAGSERLRIATVDVAKGMAAVAARLQILVKQMRNFNELQNTDSL